ncbi:phage tail protein [Chitinimonas arctica]|nr:phage tail protein [Chitinimonas arctica]
MALVQAIGQAATRAAAAAGRVGLVAAKLAQDPGQGAAMLQSVGGQAVSDIQAATSGLSQLRGTEQTLADTDRSAMGRAYGALDNAVVAIQDKGGRIVAAVSQASSATQQIAKQLAEAGQALKQANTRAQQQHPLAAGPVPTATPSPTTQRAATTSPFTGATGPASHLLILTAPSGTFYFNLSTAAHDSVKRQTAYNVASQDRLTRRPALQAVSQGGETITLSGAIFTAANFGTGAPGIGQLNRLRKIGYALEPVTLTTGFGEVLGRWYLTKIDEEQAGLLANGAPRKQTFTLEFQRYGEDYTNG